MLLNPQQISDLVTFTEEILNGKLHFLCSVHTLQLEIEGSHLRCKIANKSVKIREWVEIIGRNKYGVLPSPAVL